MRTLIVTAILMAAAGPTAGQAAPPDSLPGTSSTRERQPESPRRPRRRQNEITPAEVQENLNAGDGYTLVRRLRPRWLNNRGSPNVPDADGSYDVMVRYNGRTLGEPTTLSRVGTSQLVSLRYYPPSEARVRFGPGYGRGVIEVTGR